MDSSGPGAGQRADLRQGVLTPCRRFMPAPHPYFVKYQNKKFFENLNKKVVDKKMKSEYNPKCRKERKKNQQERTKKML